VAPKTCCWFVPRGDSAAASPAMLDPQLPQAGWEKKDQPFTAAVFNAFRLHLLTPRGGRHLFIFMHVFPLS
jgi:hypothetical protein